ncbi:cytochrome c oxidase accessory protein CcoG [Pseudochryseolinea flava]|uniref:Cytochrome c oxidase accessory protein CcoG n=1 Tax=Pseudochryseolinea flava TaxID=2059302 RepID=A0A364Y5Z8_9BACT|nr:cytochrome c oxidase accessory protein CcoG [Pseudochryseolinea flava]RAW02383.1 cytochrome c oxidase accessory protein CcoG [Pseudochryseolinea flava]
MSNGNTPAQPIETFRDSIATVDEKGKRVWIYPKKPSGFYHRWRIVVSVVLLALLFGGPFMKMNGHPLFLFNIIERKFILFGQAFWPQDFFILAVVLITFFVFIILFTVVFGRVWCGWMCPQTLFMEMVFRKIEYWIEGDAPAQRRLAQAPWTFEKIWKKTTKHFIFAIISIIIAHTVMAYIIGIDETFQIVTQTPAENITGFITLLVFTALFYGIYAKFREQACIAVCPYGRLQGVLLTKESIVVAYDWLRGEPRGHLKKSNITLNTGDCIDCKLCVHVCPTGIDIRNGTQMECVNCTACIDACDDVMIKIGKPTGLIRFASFQSITDGITKIISNRVIGYSVVLAALIGILSFVLITRSDVEATILKVPGTLYQREENFITNLYNVELINKTFDAMTIELRLVSPEDGVLQKADGKKINLNPEGFSKSIYFVKIPADQITSAKTVITLDVYANDKHIETIKAKFIGPLSNQK